MNRLSNLTKGAAMHQLLSVAGCQAAAVGNGGILRYSERILPEYAKVARYPHLLANLRQLDGSLLAGVQSTVTLEAGTCKIGLIGLTATLIGDHLVYDEGFGLHSLPPFPLIHDLTRELHQQGADVVILLSHLGHPDDRQVAAQIQGEIPLIIGAHSHHLLPAGEWVGKVLIAQAGEYAQHLGRLDLLWDGKQLQVERASILPITEDIQPLSRVLEEVARTETEVERFLHGVIGTLAAALDFATDRECGVANLMADALRERVQADLALVTAGQAFTGSLPAGPLQRITLWEVCPSPANPGVVEMSGAQLASIIARGLDPLLAMDKPRPLRGQERGLLHLSGASVRNGEIFIGEQPLAREHTYRVAGSDWELEVYGGYTDATWDLHPIYDTPLIMREALAEYLLKHEKVSVQMGRLG